MNCDEVRRHWNLYHDSEGDAELYQRINEHLGDCPACAEWFHHESRFEDLVAQALRPAAHSPELWSKVLARSGVQTVPTGQRWFFPGALLVLAASVLVAVGLWGLSRSGSEPDLVALTAERHRELSAGTVRVEFASASDAEVEAYLRRRVDFPVRCPPRKDTGFAVRGAGTSALAGEDAAYVVGEVEGRAVSVFILSKGSLSRFPRQMEALRRAVAHHQRVGGAELVASQIDRNVVLVVGSVPREVLRRILSAYGTYPHPHTAGVADDPDDRRVTVGAVRGRLEIEIGRNGVRRTRSET